MNNDMLFREFPFLRSERIIMKRIEESDADELYEIYSNENIFRMRPGNVRKNRKTVENMIGHFQRDFNKKKTIFLGIYLNGDSPELIGVGEIFDLDIKVNGLTIGYTLKESFWGKGYATEATSLMIKYLIREVGINRIQAYVMCENEKSKKVLLNNGFQKEGTIRQGAFWTGKGIVDLELYSILKDEFHP